MESAAEAEYAAFVDKVKRTVYLDNLSPQVTESVVRTALDQFGNVKSVSFIPNYIESGSIPRCALVEMENQKQARAIVSETSQFPFMMSGMPRPIRACPAEAEMFDERPIQPGRRIHCRWLDPNDPDFEVAKKLKCLVQNHAAEASFLLKQQLDREEKLAKQQAESLKANFKKYEMIEAVIKNKTSGDLARYYSMKDGT
uniref:Uncharacterized protein MANES_03G131800 n=1 Tax=Rhizophora mucronata TaxID=61149 RepID=A0A2P2JT93_RHIMU